MTKFGVLVLSFLVFTGCSNDSEWQGKKEIHNGVTYISNPEQGIWRNSRQLILEKEFSLGTGAQGENDALVNPTDIAVDRSGNILICDAGAHAIKVYDSTGVFLRDIGRKGNGPGELKSALHLALGKNGDVFVLDTGNQRVNIYSQVGEYLQSFSYPFTLAGDMLVTSNDEILLAAAAGVGSSQDNLIYVFNRDGKQLRSFGEPVMAPHPSTAKRSMPGQPKLAWKSDIELICAFSYPYKIRVYDLNGTLLREIMHDSPVFTEPELSRDSGRLLTRSRISWCVAFPDGKFLVGVEDHGQDFRSGFRERMRTGGGISFAFDLFDAEDRFLQTFPINPPDGAIFYVDRSGNAYTRSESEKGALILKCRVDFRKTERRNKSKVQYSPSMSDYLKHLRGKPKAHELRDYALQKSAIIQQDMALIPGGEFIMGSDDPFFQSEGFYDFGYPARKVFVDSFYLDKYEVTNAMYREFIEVTGHPLPETWIRDFRKYRWDHPNQPITKISWYDAQAYTKWAGKRLPTEAEWEYAARGGLVQKTFPWGDSRDSTLANLTRHTKPVGSYPPNAFGLYDMAGNAAEWVSDFYDKGRTPTAMRVFKGRCFRTRPDCILNAARSGLEPNRKLFVILGFRCAKDVR